MKKILLIVAVLVLGISVGCPLNYEPVVVAADGIDIDWSGFIRVRPEFMDNFSDATDYDETTAPFSDDEGGFVHTRASLSMLATMPNDVYGYLELNTLSFDDQYGNWGSGPDGSLIVLYQAYLSVEDMWGSNFDLKAGRFEITFADEFVFGNSDFYHGLAHDGMMGSMQFDQGSLDVFWVKQYDSTPFFSPYLTGSANSETDGDLYAVYTSWNVGLDSQFDAYFGVQNLNAYFPTFFGSTAETNTTFLGLRWAKDKGDEAGLDWKAELVYEDNEYHILGATTSTDGIGWAFDGRIGYTFDNDMNPWIAFGYARFNGDDDATDADGYNPLFMELDGRYGLSDYMIIGGLFSPFGGDGFGADIFQLNFAADATDSFDWGANFVWVDAGEVPAGMDDHVSTEYDIFGNYQYSENLAFNTAIAYVDLGDFFGDPDNLIRAYVNAVVSW